MAKFDYFVRPGCGHQHSSVTKAKNCCASKEPVHGVKLGKHDANGDRKVTMKKLDV